MIPCSTVERVTVTPPRYTGGYYQESRLDCDTKVVQFSITEIYSEIKFTEIYSDFTEMYPEIKFTEIYSDFTEMYPDFKIGISYVLYLM